MAEDNSELSDLAEAGPVYGRAYSSRYGGFCGVFKRLAGLAVVAALLLVQGTSRGTAETPRELLIVALGDSLTAGYDLPLEDAFPSRLEQALKARGHSVKIHNAGVSGDTTAGALARLDWALPQNADGVIVELGANDALRGIDPATTRRNLAKILDALGQRGQAVLVAGMLAPPNMGAEFSDRFNPIFADLADANDALLYPFFLDGVAARPALNLGDGMHPNAEGVAEIVERIMPYVEQLIEKIEARRKTG